MNEILHMDIGQMAGAQFACACGRTHRFPIQHLYIGEQTLAKVVDVAKCAASKRLFVFGDQNTKAAAGDAVVSLLEAAGFAPSAFWFPAEPGTMLIPDESALGVLLMQMPSDVSMIIGVGSGCINDLGKFLSHKTGLPHTIVCTAPSMDGYVSDSSALTNRGQKISYPSTLPFAVIGDIDILKRAPTKMLQAGFGDVIGKLTALADWRLSKENTGEYYCETCVELVQRALDEVTGNVQAIARRETKGIDALMRALVLTGVAMALVNVSRPASGAEHMLSHYWEMAFQKEGRFAELHGIKVGVATPVVARLFEMLQAHIPTKAMALAPSYDSCIEMLTAMGSPLTPKDVHISRELFVESIIHAYSVRKRYSILQLGIDLGLIEQCAESLANEIYTQRGD